MSAPEPLSAERRADIEALAGDMVHAADMTGASAIRTLIAEVDRLRSSIVDLEAEREVLSVDEHGEDDVLDRDFYRCPNTGEWVYKWADERYVAVETLQLRELEARAAADTPKLQATNEQLGQAAFDAVATIERGVRSREWHAEVLCAVGGLVRAAAFTEEPAAPPEPEPAGCTEGPGPCIDGPCHPSCLATVDPCPRCGSLVTNISGAVEDDFGNVAVCDDPWHFPPATTPEATTPGDAR